MYRYQWKVVGPDLFLFDGPNYTLYLVHNYANLAGKGLQIPAGTDTGNEGNVNAQPPEKTPIGDCVTQTLTQADKCVYAKTDINAFLNAATYVVLLSSPWLGNQAAALSAVASTNAKP